ncbi:hypothetical protein Sked_08900 [Sanguibacter keddieii DSM 10542]|uniref:Uncharacterized protein n=1 Tax=Sanguibacter keddieii (strain ATCC 51767 / DSM 10542 / NCFB 3025 / ST-74) TaxID=446469 RepID=D1BC61_SANKS|nr:DUF6541 family protein [Sanguibacter keddieii]ACZ20841.1 hypothetical protein Sked_08900 [Sanguibacter keddieii DSM 10542]
MSWASTWEEVLRGILVLAVPGALVGYAVGLRRWWLVATAPALSVGTLATWGVLLSFAGIPWTVLSVGAATLLTAGVLLGAQTALRRVWRPDRAALGWWPATVAGVAVAGFLGVVAMRDGMAHPDAPPQTWDAIFHLNAVQRVLDTQDASSLHLGQLTAPLRDPAIYPAAWHGLVSFVVVDNVVVATNVVAILVAAVVFPLGCALLAAALLPGSRLLPGLTAVAGVAFVAFPGRMVSYGTLWPNALGYALLPVALALTVRLLDQAPVADRRRGPHVGARHVAAPATTRRGAREQTAAGHLPLDNLAPATTETSRTPLVLALLLTLVAVTAAHPNALIGYGAVSAALVLVGVVRVAAVAVVERRYVELLALVLTTGAVVVLATLIFRSPQMQSVIAYERGTYATPLEAVWQALSDTQLTVIGAGNGDPSWVLAGLTVLGFLVALVRSRLRWLALAYAVVLTLFVAANDPTLPIGALAGPWYSDAVRLGGLVVVVAVPLVGLGLLLVAQVLGLGLRALLALVPAPRSPRRAGALRGAVVSVIGVAVVVAFLATTGLARQDLREHRILAEYGRSDDPAWPGIVTTGEIELMERLADELPEDSVVLGNPFTGAPLLYAISGTEVVFPHLRGAWTPESRYLGLHLADIATDPEVCRLIDELGVTHLYVDPQLYWPEHSSRELYAGMGEEPPAVEGFTLVDQAERARIYAVDAC